MVNHWWLGAGPWHLFYRQLVQAINGKADKDQFLLTMMYWKVLGSSANVVAPFKGLPVPLSHVFRKFQLAYPMGNAHGESIRVEGLMPP